METPAPVRSVPDTAMAAPTAGAIRSVLLAIAAFWLLVQAFSRVEDSAHDVIALLQRLAFGCVLVAVALIDWRRFRWWWLIVALVVVGLAWTATGHPLLFLVGGG